MLGWYRGRVFPISGHHVVCVDSDEQKIAALNNGEMPIHEPGITELVDKKTSDKAALRL